jgi:glyoxylase-like metal-dependent hydrolase (beta-lactamase superfamily II)
MAILNTHGHFDHVWSNAELKKAWPQTPIVCPYEDVFLATQDRFMQGQPLSTVDIMVGAPEGAEVQTFQSTTSNIGRRNLLQWEDLVTEFVCYPGHTPGNSVIILWHQDEPEKKVMFSGDFIFYRSIGRSDFPFSSHSVMKASLKEVMKMEEDMPVFPGHDTFTRLSDEKRYIPSWIASM